MIGHTLTVIAAVIALNVTLGGLLISTMNSRFNDFVNVFNSNTSDSFQAVLLAMAPQSQRSWY